jgi:hypothetical protein
MSAALVCGLPRLGRGRPPPVARTAYENEVQAFCTVSSKSTLDSNSRPAAALGYLLEGEGTITKGELDAAQRLISDCRKSGLLPIDMGFLSIETPPGMIINELKLMLGARGTRWIGLPSVKQVDNGGQPLLDAQGKPLWNRIVEFRDEATGAKFEEMVLEALRAAFRGEGAR